MPIQLSLISLVCIGIPSFILALEPNKERVKGKFIGNVISKSIPTALTVILNIVIVLILNIFSFAFLSLSLIKFFYYLLFFLKMNLTRPKIKTIDNTAATTEIIISFVDI